MSVPMVTKTVTTTALAAMAPPSLEALGDSFAQTFVYYLNFLGKLPGGSIILKYIKLSYKNDPIRSLFELALFIFAVHYFLSSKRKENKADTIRFSDKEINELVAEWEPEPLVDEVTPREKWLMKSIPQIIGANGSKAFIKGVDGPVVNFASCDYLNMSELERVREVTKLVISSSGVGACGPPNFYGSADVHVRLEEDLATYLGAERAILYGQDFVTAGSVLPSFLKRGDLCVVDSGINLAIQKALIVSRCDIEWFDHNDPEHLEQILNELKPVLDKQKIRRRFIVTEGIFETSGEICSLPKIVELKDRFKYRLFLDESRSIGVLGQNGKGVAEHYNIPRSDINITIGALSNSFASSGGFCVGVVPMIHHQRILSLAYVFSASLPPYCAKVASEVIHQILESTDDGRSSSSIISQLRDITKFSYQLMEKHLSSELTIYSDSNNPLIHVGLAQKYRELLGFPNYYGSAQFLTTGKPSRYLNEFDKYYNWESFILQKIIDLTLKNSNILITRSKLILEHESLPVLGPHLLINIKRTTTKQQVEDLAHALASSSKKVFANLHNNIDVLNLERELLDY
ncbi:serine palmitoyltransferase component [Scheffersomyces spartinae]|uniref:serine C-palmitoyltransferase n=1 Tax=Scheffersomyces spartinae TaxID=45513 RepID=A0A9P7VET3_9ASCO|nr:serine palmitoyltransferase component [Scheffersomyces spartinae]KAG7195926.1 serine palmitoyltransferase component [Scheffersomyces spartinae]